MQRILSTELNLDIADTVDQAVSRHGIVNIPQLAEQIRLRNVAENVALEDIAERLLLHAGSRSAAMEFDSLCDDFGKRPASRQDSVVCEI